MLAPSKSGWVGITRAIRMMHRRASPPCSVSNPPVAPVRFARFQPRLFGAHASWRRPPYGTSPRPFLDVVPWHFMPQAANWLLVSRKSRARLSAHFGSNGALSKARLLAASIECTHGIESKGQPDASCTETLVREGQRLSIVPTRVTILSNLRECSLWRGVKTAMVRANGLSKGFPWISSMIPLKSVSQFDPRFRLSGYDDTFLTNPYSCFDPCSLSRSSS